LGHFAVDPPRRSQTQSNGETPFLGVLDDYLTRLGDLITPVVVWCPQVAVLVANREEVAAAHVVPVVELDDPEAPRLLGIPESDRPVIQMPVMGRWIHAPTAAVLYHLREAGFHGRSTRVCGYEEPVGAWGRGVPGSAGAVKETGSYKR